MEVELGDIDNLYLEALSADFEDYYDENKFPFRFLQALLSFLYNDNMEDFGFLITGFIECSNALKLSRVPFLNHFCDKTKEMMKDRALVGDILHNSQESRPIRNLMVSKEFEILRPFDPEDPYDVKNAAEKKCDEIFELIDLDFEGEFIRRWLP